MISTPRLVLAETPLEKYREMLGYPLLLLILVIQIMFLYFTLQIERDLCHVITHNELTSLLCITTYESQPCQEMGASLLFVHCFVETCLFSLGHQKQAGVIKNRQKSHKLIEHSASRRVEPTRRFLI